MKYSQTLINEYESSNIASRKEVFLGPTVKRGITEFRHGIMDVPLARLLVSRERFYCNNNASYMLICLRQCI